jgi:predicted O-methyltransferase YrrM
MEIVTGFDTDRTALAHMLNHHRLDGVGVEIGVFQGFYSELILRHSNLKLLVSVDLWYNEYNFQYTYRTLLPYGERSSMIKASSQVASSFFPDNYFDFVYIDADHSYHAVCNDIECWWPKCKDGGMFAGHDYMDEFIDRDGELHKYGVKQAVDEFADAKGQSVHTVGRWPSWYCFKNRSGVTLL